MIIEIARFFITPGSESQFVDGFTTARRLMQAAEGIHAVRLVRCIEAESEFVVIVEWDSVEAHERFRATEQFPVWRGHISSFFAKPPAVQHFDPVVSW